MKPKNKYVSESGASIVIALILLLVCAMVSTVIITSASVNAERSSRETEEKQAYHSVSSAIQASQDILVNSQVSDLVVWVSGNETKTFERTDFDGEAWSDNGREWGKWVAEAAEAIANGADTYGPYSEKIDSFDSALPKVKLALTMDGEYTITIKAQLDDSELRPDFSADLAYAITTKVSLKGRAMEPDGSLGLHWVEGTPNKKTPDVPDEPEEPEKPKPLDPPPEALFYQSTVWGDENQHDEWFFAKWRQSGFRNTKIDGLYPYVWHSTRLDYVVCLQYNGNWFIPTSLFDREYGLPGGWMDCAVAVENWANLIDQATGKPRDGNYPHVARRAQVWGRPSEYAPNGSSWPVKWKVVRINA